MLNDGTVSRLVFARVKGPLGDLMYRFKGEYKTDKEAANYETGAVHKRIATRVKTYPSFLQEVIMFFGIRLVLKFSHE